MQTRLEKIRQSFPLDIDFSRIILYTVNVVKNESIYGYAGIET